MLYNAKMCLDITSQCHTALTATEQSESVAKLNMQVDEGHQYCMVFLSQAIFIYFWQMLKIRPRFNVDETAMIEENAHVR